MLVRDLMAILEQLNPELEVVMACDSEGNDYSPLAQVDEALYIAETTWSGYLEEPGILDSPNAIALYPTN